MNGMSLPGGVGGDIFYSVGPNGNFFDGILVRLGNYSDNISVLGTLKTPGNRTTTVLNTGDGDDFVNKVSSLDSSDDFLVLYLEASMILFTVEMVKIIFLEIMVLLIVLPCNPSNRSPFSLRFPFCLFCDYYFQF